MDYVPNYSDYGTCHKCGAGIKYKFYYGGNTYGSSCIDRMLGISVRQYNTTDVDAIVNAPPAAIVASPLTLPKI